jgi:hypothetical protein
MEMLSKDKKHAKVTLKQKGVIPESTSIPDAPPLPVPHRASA